jgi:TetR/AcrR family transcriptional regulator, fatty acid metabolism regulator protein
VACDVDHKQPGKRLHGAGTYHYAPAALTDGSITVDKRRLLLDAAVRVFARKGFHAARVGDIAEEAGVAHGLLYHYFASKDEVLETIFRDTWSDLVAAVRDVEQSGEPAVEQLRRIAAIVLRSWRHEPDLVRVLVREVARSAEVERRIDEIGEVFAAIERIVRGGQETGEFRGDVDARLATFVLYGALEEILTGWVLGQLPDEDDEVLRAERTVAALVNGGLVRVPELTAERD